MKDFLQFIEMFNEILGKVLSNPTTGKAILGGLVALSSAVASSGANVPADLELLKSLSVIADNLNTAHTQVEAAATANK